MTQDQAGNPPGASGGVRDALDALFRENEIPMSDRNGALYDAIASGGVGVSSEPARIAQVLELVSVYVDRCVALNRTRFGTKENDDVLGQCEVAHEAIKRALAASPLPAPSLGEKPSDSVSSCRAPSITPRDADNSAAS